MRTKTNDAMKEYIRQRIEEYMNDDDESVSTLFEIGLLYQLGRIADALERGVRINGTVDTYEHL